MDTILRVVRPFTTLIGIYGAFKLSMTIQSYLDRRASHQPGTGDEGWEIMSSVFLIALGAGGLITSLFTQIGAIN